MTGEQKQSLNPSERRGPAHHTPARPENHTADATPDNYTLYLREIGRITLLSPAEELALARRVRSGDQQAREQMIAANLRLVVKIAREYEGYGLPLLDLIAEGNIGLMKAIDRFDPEKGAKLSTYASWWIRQYVRRALSDQSKTVRLPNHVVGKLAKLRQMKAHLANRLGREPTETELARKLGVAPRQVRNLHRADMRTVSLNTAPSQDDSSDELGDLLADDRIEGPDVLLTRSAEIEVLSDLIKTLPEREATILRLHFGLHGDDQHTLEQIGAKYGVTRERIRQIEAIALRKLRRQMQKLELAA